MSNEEMYNPIKSWYNSGMIIVDYSGIAIAAIFSQDRPGELSEHLLRHMVLNTIRRYNYQFRDKYGELVIAVDSSSWRKEYFPQYKAGRKKNRDESPLDWKTFFEYINLVRDEIHENMPYKVISANKAEADDVIGQLVLSTQEFGKNEPVMIVSSDKDFFQLHQFSNVKQFSPIKRDMINVDDPHFFLFEHICKGDVGDGIPNVLSDDDTFVNGERQKPLRAKTIQEWFEAGDALEKLMPTNVWRNFNRNQKLIDLQYTPEDIKHNILEIYNTNSGKSNSKVLNYLIEKRCNMLVSSVDEFFVKT